MNVNQISLKQSNYDIRKRDNRFSGIRTSQSFGLRESLRDRNWNACRNSSIIANITKHVGIWTQVVGGLLMAFGLSDYLNKGSFNQLSLWTTIAGGTISFGSLALILITFVRNYLNIARHNAGLCIHLKGK